MFLAVDTLDPKYHSPQNHMHAIRLNQRLLQRLSRRMWGRERGGGGGEGEREREGGGREGERESTQSDTERERRERHTHTERESV